MVPSVAFRNDARAEAVICASALVYDVTLVTGDAHFEGLAAVDDVTWKDAGAPPRVGPPPPSPPAHPPNPSVILSILSSYPLRSSRGDLHRPLQQLLRGVR